MKHDHSRDFLNGKTVEQAITEGRIFSKEELRKLLKSEVVMIYRSIFHNSPHCHSDEAVLWEEIFEAIVTRVPQKIDLGWD